MSREEIKRYIGNLLNILDIENNKIIKITDFITRLKEHDVDEDTEEHYHQINERDKYLKEEIDLFLLNK